MLASLPPRIFLRTKLPPFIAARSFAIQSDPPSRAHSAPYQKRTHNCGALNLSHAGSRVVLAGWLSPGRKAGKQFAFFPLRDANGTAQLVVHDTKDDSTFNTMCDIPPESTVLVEGIVNARPQNQRRPIPSGDIEIQVNSVTLLNRADSDLPFMPLDNHNLANEELRLRYRYLDLRRPALSDNIRKRSQVAHIVRTVLHEYDFCEVETPILLKSSPEGAREFLVPSRISNSTQGSSESSASTPTPRFYALPQSPQQPKQLLVASGAVERYYQLARCFRDEDGRKDRQPEFTQVDLEMAWLWSHEWRIGGSEVKEVIETTIRKIWSEVEGVELPTAFQVMTYAEAMARFGSDKPDMRFSLELQDISTVLPAHVQAALSQRGELIEALVVTSDSPFFRAAAGIRQDTIEPGVEQIDLSEAGISSWLQSSDILRSLSVDELHAPTISDALISAFQESAKMWITKRPRKSEGGSSSLGRLRLSISATAQQLEDVVLPSAPQFLWVTEFPLFTRADSDKDFLAQGRWSSSHHPFTAPMWQDIQKIYDGRISEVRGQHYDLVLNGVEIGGGSVRVHDASMQEYIFSDVLQLTKEETACFNHLLHALRCFDRLMAILCKTESIRDVIAFPKTSAGTDLLFNSPAPAPTDVLDQYHIQPSSRA
ncbi:tRNA synthetases class II-domain-containing protein [Cristinia sonorae]|uniref:tRNA synthetases class II-domain-containing protein n=1 Tax=Cristinia sonorae TaxID=1940300 RepID=A0A8K0UWI0_9AGAR|nr:tRNA synthetases class II-domain-containing protein [Cristinia sonorae]